MAARLNPRNSALARQKIQVTKLIQRLQSHTEGEVEMSATQIQAAKILLDKSLSNAPTQVGGIDGEPIKHAVKVSWG